MGLLLIVLGIIFWFFISTFLGIICIVVGVILLFVPGVPYGYSSWHGRRGPPP